MKITETTNHKGFPRKEFKDDHFGNCEIEISSTLEHLWIGRIENPMHLHVSDVAKIIPILQKFVEEGTI